jgi:hypothetical protein
MEAKIKSQARVECIENDEVRDLQCQVSRVWPVQSVENDGVEGLQDYQRYQAWLTAAGPAQCNEAL